MTCHPRTRLPAQGGDSAPAAATPAAAKAAADGPSGAQRAFHVLLPLLLIVAAIVLNMYMGASKA
jgi:hypothetical protein